MSPVNTEGHEGTRGSAGPSSGGTHSSALPELVRSLELASRAQGGDLAALRELLWSYRERLQRAVSIRTGARLRAFLEADDLLQDAYLLAMRKLGDLQLTSHAAILLWLARIAESQVRSKLDYFLGRREPEEARALRLGDPSRGVTEIALSGTASPRAALRAEFERLVDSYVEQLEPSELREVLLLRDYFGADWEAIRAALGRDGVEEVRSLYRQAQEKLRRRLRPHLERRPG